MRTTEPTLADILRDLAVARRWLVAGLVLGLAAGILFVAAAVPQYRATMLVTPTTRSGTPDISALFPNNASFAMEYVMQSFGPGDSSDFSRFETIMRESTIAGMLLNDSVVRQGVQKAYRYRIDGQTPPDTPEKMAAWLQKNIVIEPVGDTRLKRVVFLHPDSAFATYLLSRLYALTDDLIRRELREKTQKRITWLQDRLKDTLHPDHRRALTQLLMDQEQISMILAVDEPFAALLAEPPSAGPVPHWPRRSLVLPVFAGAGIFIGYMMFIVRRVFVS